jgi:DMSO/TMAO reductase YedYZ molybdopterin-dependent catalytic subunit
MGAVSRRGVLVGGVAVLVGGAGWWLVGRGGDTSELKNPDGQAPGVLPPYITPTDSFYTYRNQHDPAPDPASLLLVGPGTLELGVDELRSLGLVTVPRTLHCVGQGKPSDPTFSWRFGGASTAVWGGVPLRRLLRHARLEPEGKYCRVHGRDHWLRVLPWDVVMRDDDVLLALEMNGEPLSHAHGAPTRLLVPGDYGEMSVKWVEEIELGGARPPDQVADGLPVHPMAWATGPGWGQQHQGPLELFGVSYAGAHAVEAVELAVEGMPPVQAELIDPPEPCVWRRWRATLDLPVGWHTIQIAAVDAAGRRSQPLRRGTPWGKTGQAATHDLRVGRQA